ncbi:MAG: hypothetical protein M1482_08440 [Chloroflexi bacterium]|nr:hypothetical protein [Chloroflexota bacterium]
MFLNLLHFGSGAQATDYFVLCFFGILGTLQAVAVRYRREDLLWIDGRPGYFLAAALIAGGYVWYFVVDTEIFIPGLAGGELFTLFATAFAVAIPVTRVAALGFAHVRAPSLAPEREVSDEEPLL